MTAGAHAILILDQAGWHGAKELKIPSNISLLQLPPRAPELNSQENIWQFIRQNWLSTGSSNPSTTSSITVAMPGTPSSISPGKSCPSHVATSRIGISRLQQENYAHRNFHQLPVGILVIPFCPSPIFQFALNVTWFGLLNMKSDIRTVFDTCFNI